MAKIDPRVDAYIESAPEFAQPILRKVRAAFHAGCPDLTETIKWSVPSFEKDGMLGGMAAFKAHVSFGFWKAPLMEDPHDILGPEPKASPMHVKASTVRDLPTKKVIVSYVKQAVRLNADGVSLPKARTKKPAPRAPKYMLDAIREDAAAHATWKGFSAASKREYVEWITEAKREATREKRLAQAVEWMAEGKTRNWKYRNC